MKLCDEITNNNELDLVNAIHIKRRDKNKSFSSIKVDSLNISNYEVVKRITSRIPDNLIDLPIDYI